MLLAGTVEAVVVILARENCILSLFDESSQFLGSFGRYNHGGSSYDRSIYLDLFNGRQEFRRDLANKRTVVKFPRLNICLLGHPVSFFKLMKEEQSLDDGMMQRFLSCSPKPSFSDSYAIAKSSSVVRPFSLSVLLYAIKTCHNILNPEFNPEVKIGTPRKFRVMTYKFDDDAMDEYKTIYSEYRQYSKKMHDHDVFIR